MSTDSTAPSAAPNAAWSDDLLWALSMFDSAVLLLDGQRHLAHANHAARELAARVHAGDAGAGGLLALLPEDAWAATGREGRWRGTVVAPGAGDDTFLEAGLYCGARGEATHSFVVFNDVTRRAQR